MSKRNRDGSEAAGAPDAAATRWTDYVWVYLIFLGFIVVLCYATWLTCQAPGDDQIPVLGKVLQETLWFFGLLMGGGFLLVVFFDAAYEFFAGKAEQAPPSPDPPKA